MKKSPGPSESALLNRVIIAISATLVVLGLGVLSFFTIQGGPNWGMSLKRQGGVVVASKVQDNGVADNEGITAGTAIRQIDGRDPNSYLNRALTNVSRVTWQDSQGAVHIAEVTRPSPGFVLLLIFVGLVFASLGGVVYRWSPDSTVRATFFLFGVSVAIVLVTSSAGELGYGWAWMLTDLDSVIAGASFCLFSASFPHTVRWFRPLAAGMVVTTAAVIGVTAWFVLLNISSPDWVTTIGWLLFLIQLLVAMSFLVSRTIRSSTRARLVPVVVGFGIGIAPVVLLSALPVLIAGSYIIPTAYTVAGSVAAPIGITYAIIRHHLFGLDAMVRRFLIGLAEVASVAFLVGLGWLAVETTHDNVLILIAAALALGIAIPILTPRISLAVDALLYPSIARARRGADLTRLSSLPELGGRMTRLAREVVPVQWSLLALRGARASDTLDRSGRGRGWIVASDGDLPILSPGAISWENSAVHIRNLDPEAYTATPITSNGVVFGVLLVGPRLDGSRMDSIDVEALRLFVDRSVMAIEAALLREQSEEEERYREGLARFAQALASAGSARDVLELTARYTSELLDGNGGRIWESAPDHTVTVLATTGDEALTPPSPDRSIERSSGSEPVEVYLSEDCFAFQFYLRGSGVSDTVGIVVRAEEKGPFGPRDSGRLGEILEYTGGALGRARAVSAAAEAETLREIDRVRTEIFDMVSHDLQSPLTVVRGYAELLQIRAAHDEFVAESADAILNAYRSCQSLIDDLLTTSRSDKGKLSLNLEDLNIGEVLETLTAVHRVLPGGDRLEVETEAGAVVKADRTRLEQMIGNLVSNAIRYAPQGPILLRGYRTGAQVVVEVRDRGPGIPPAELPRIWEKFYRAGTGRAAPRGTGVGLSVVRTLAELHGGHAEAESVLGEGTTFRLTFPVAGRLVRDRDGGFERPADLFPEETPVPGVTSR